MNTGGKKPDLIMWKSLLCNKIEVVSACLTTNERDQYSETGLNLFQYVLKIHFALKLLGNHCSLPANKLHLPPRLYLFLCPQQCFRDLLIFWKVLYWNLEVLFILCFWVILFENLWKRKGVWDIEDR